MSMIFSLYPNSYICNYVDDTTICSFDENLDVITQGLENDSSIALEWFTDNFMRLNPEKCHFLVLGQRSDVPVTVRIGNIDVVNSSNEKLLGIQIDSKLSFDKHVANFLPED